MSLRCGCANEGDEIVFGPQHECNASSRPPAIRRSVDPTEALVGALNRYEWPHVRTAVREFADRLVPREQPYEHVLDESERRGD